MSQRTAAPVAAKDIHCRAGMGRCHRHASRLQPALRSRILLLSLLTLVLPLCAASSNTRTTPTGVITKLVVPGAVHAACRGIPLPPGEPGAGPPSSAPPSASRPPCHTDQGLQPSGPQWVRRYPTSRSIADLTPAFGAAVSRFIDAIQHAGGSVVISATLRPPQRAYLMHYAWLIARDGLDPSAVPPMEGVNIDWAHLDQNCVPDRAAAIQAAREMVADYVIVFEPSLTSLHTQGRAIDMTIRGIIGKTIMDANGRPVVVHSMSVLYSVGRSYGVIKLIRDPPHWSDNGH